MNEKTLNETVPSAEPEVVTLRDGTKVTIRPIRPDDAPRLQALHSRLSPESIFFRFLGHRKELPRVEAERLANVDYQTRMAFVATLEPCEDECIIGVARYSVVQPSERDVAEAAIVVEDAYQGRGLGTILLERLVAYARGHGIHAFVASIRYDNVRILHFVRRSGLPTESEMEDGTLEIRVELTPESGSAER